ncbi:GNAT family N-acetyltransferase [Mesorhizobium sp. M1C.F.Ca.ET.193.01.1.1]|uniref:GNAT family N-acetyltransferase n=1 Tax=unclassified Mesorhizobium TaxID=325217 RepID=UPI000FD35759|nr:MULTISPECIES: GNAT family N-acetyltransferase [unclassified Mesorhizobium]TGS98241.1 GNAT family N-acetyltransferase [bacterium M00.F.Ca.ET.177.01.1.1]TGQ52655.1 GNAT family N-acetyltransferase [Mesorhizobium sp. M1C.F.Ca.ET.210.01.1.1]TGQ70022.1 GNAT family N-acetyltransferase [Mesorhizobium sp. M1C.F.Ca.ET.212.01.1.1]TGR05523.1 GNAT family N-acetyltransferase [Mesorhizobium sp. M1C.F.Ca.ET.204.01.1.1]TGR26258.1 GNAT family N-acetyltransferase [Mesorhizobium sp. M1C.F.Ca.ET.196.01.1.1]
MKTTLEITAEPLPRDLAFVGESLTAFNDGDVGVSGRKTLAVFVRDDAGAIVAGISGYTAWGWLYVQWLWVDEKLRGRRIAAGMLEAAEREALARGCQAAWIDTFNPTAAKVYQRQGYQPFGTLADFPVGRNRIFLQKKLS